MLKPEDVIGGNDNATEAAYDAGESDDYHSANPMRSWAATVEGMRRIRAMERDRILAENRAK